MDNFKLSEQWPVLVHNNNLTMTVSIYLTAVRAVHTPPAIQLSHAKPSVKDWSQAICCCVIHVYRLFCTGGR